MRADQVEAAWSIITPVLKAWEQDPPVDFPNYRASSWGPEAAEILIAQDGRSWIQPNPGSENFDDLESGEVDILGRENQSQSTVSSHDGKGNKEMQKTKPAC
jgi:hypothetical protein